GFCLGYVALLLARGVFGPSAYFVTMQRAVSFLGFFLKEVFIANLRVAHDVLTPPFYMRPRVLALPLDALTDIEITLLANLISLTPGTLSLDVSSDQRVLYVHAMYAVDAEAARREMKEGLERRLLTLLRGTSAGNNSGEQSPC
ncbi:MAG: Na+/H+ antiporter subunit E, partial [Deltaproteobacteria bacterium]|nr:Na+/H+ antiporter subunit E [Deltaproteobacteria bacterium]